MSEPHCILVADDEPVDRDYLRSVLEINSCRVEFASTGLEALDRAQKEPVPDLILLDTLLPNLSGLKVLKKLREARPNLKVVMLSGMCEPRLVVESIRLGALDYLSKPFRRSELEKVVKRVLHASIPSRNGNGHDNGNGNGKGNGSDPAIHVEDLGDNTKFVFASAVMARVREQAALIASADVPILLLGESGTGKGVIARLIHKLSHRAKATFLKVNCAALPSELLESELFGYEAGAFTGATRSKPGKFELADKGTILLDEIGDMSPGLQAKLLHVLQDQEFFRLGGRSPLRINVRVIAATNLDMKEAVASGKIRQDLYYRLNTLTLHLPPLRERTGEIPLLMRHFMSQFAELYQREPRPFSDIVIESACRYSWPGNLRELENFVKRYLIMGDESELLRELRADRREPCESAGLSSPDASNGSRDLKALVRGLQGGAEVRAICDVLDQTNWNRKEAARRLHISYKALLNKIQKYELGKGPRVA